MPQNALTGWHFAWPKWITGRNAGKQAVNKDYVDQSIANAVGGDAPGGGLPGTLRFVNVDGDAMTGALVLPGDPTLALQAATKNYVDIAIVDVGTYS